MGKEAVYRRLRGEVSFTIDEVALLSQKLGISIDQIVGSHVSNKVTFDLNLLHASSALESYYEIINRYLQIFDYVKTDNTTEVFTASNSLPFVYNVLITSNCFCKKAIRCKQRETHKTLWILGIKRKGFNRRAVSE